MILECLSWFGLGSFVARGRSSINNPSTADHYEAKQEPLVMWIQYLANCFQVCKFSSITPSLSHLGCLLVHSTFQLFLRNYTYFVIAIISAPHRSIDRSIVRSFDWTLRSLLIDRSIMPQTWTLALRKRSESTGGLSFVGALDTYRQYNLSPSLSLSQLLLLNLFSASRLPNTLSIFQSSLFASSSFVSAKSYWSKQFATSQLRLFLINVRPQMLAHTTTHTCWWNQLH